MSLLTGSTADCQLTNLRENPTGMRNGAIRLSVVILSLMAWFGLSNHCALGTIGPAESTPEAGGCPMHSAPVKKKPVAKIPCCKNVRAVVAKCVTANPLALRLLGTREYAAENFPPPVRAAIEIEGGDTGPPGSFSFAESVLQKSLLSHAPPLS